MEGVQAARLREEGGSRTRSFSRARPFPEALAPGTRGPCPSPYGPESRAGGTGQGEGRKPGLPRVASGEVTWPRGGGGDGESRGPAAPSSRFAASQAKAARSRPVARGGGARRAEAALQVGAARAPLCAALAPGGGVPPRRDASPTVATWSGPDRCVARASASHPDSPARGGQRSPLLPAKRNQRARGEQPGPGGQAGPGPPTLDVSRGGCAWASGLLLPLSASPTVERGPREVWPWLCGARRPAPGNAQVWRRGDRPSAWKAALREEKPHPAAGARLGG